jgi:hypothetical protein
MIGIRAALTCASDVSSCEEQRHEMPCLQDD